MTEIQNLIAKRLNEIESELRTLNSRSQKNEGFLRISHDKKRKRYYREYYDADGQKKSKYISIKDSHIYSKLATQEYDKAAELILQKEYDSLSKFARGYDEGKLGEYYDSLHPDRKCLFEPLELSDKEFVYRWLTKPFEPKEIPPDCSTYKTLRGEYVRSKSEKIIADTLYHYKIPYKYECPLQIGGRIFYPDFTTLNVRLRREIVWEHFGMVDKPEYYEGMVSKMNFFTDSGMVLGKNYIFTHETSFHPLKTEYVENTIKYILL